MTVVVSAVVVPEDVPTDLRAAAKSLADRKVVRFLDEVSTPPFLVAMQLLRGPGSTIDPATVGLFTTSAWEGDVATPTGLEDASDPDRVVRYYLDESNPTDWLRAMPNDALCQAAIVGGIRGPNTHFVGGPAALMHCLVTAERAVADGAASAAIVVAFDRDRTTATVRAAGLLLELGSEAGLTEASTVIDALDPGDGDAVDALVASVARSAGGGVATGARASDGG